MGNVSPLFNLFDLWAHDSEISKLVLNTSNYNVLASVSQEDGKFYVGFELDPSEQFSPNFEFETYEEVLAFTSKILHVLEVAKRTDNDLISLYKEVYAIEYKGSFFNTTDALFDDINAFFGDTKSNDVSFLDNISYNVYSYCENAWDHQPNLGVFLEDERCVNAFLESQYQKNKGN